MSEPMTLLQTAVTAHGQAAVAREIGYSPSAVNQVLKGTYGGSLDNLLRRVAERYGTGFVMCPLLGQISLRRCADERRRPFGATNPLRVRLYAACKWCKENRLKGDRPKAEGGRG